MCLFLLLSAGVFAQTGNVYGKVIDGLWHDAGDPLKYIIAVVDTALESEEYGPAVADYLKNRLQ